MQNYAHRRPVGHARIVSPGSIVGAPLDFEGRGGTFKVWPWGVEVETESFSRDPSVLTGTWGVLRIACSNDAMMSRDAYATRKNSPHFR